MKELANSVVHSKKSAIRKLFELVLTAKNAISFGIGQPDFPTPTHVLDAIKKACDQKITMYAPATGIPQLREAAAEKFRKENGMDWVQAKNIMITNGGSQALQFSYAVLLNPGDEVIINSPDFLSYYYLTEFNQGKIVEVKKNDDFSYNIDGIKKAITPKTKFIILNSPNNPTGYTASRKEIESIVDIAVDKDLYIVSDEVYERFIFDDKVHFSPASLKGLEDRVITLNAMSKTFAAPGLRLGYIAASETIINEMEKYAQYTSAGVSHPTQYGALEALKTGNPEMEKVRVEYQAKRDYSYKRLVEMGFDVVKPTGAFYIMPKVSKIMKSGDDFSTQLMIDQEVAVTPGSAFGSYSEDYIRISYATANQKLEEGFNRMEKFVNKIMKK